MLFCSGQFFVNQKPHRNPYIAVIQCDGHDSEKAAKEYLDQMTEHCAVKSKSVQKGSLELTVEIRLKSDDTDFINVLAEMPGVVSAVLVSYNGEYAG